MTFMDWAKLEIDIKHALETVLVEYEKLYSGKNARKKWLILLEKIYRIAEKGIEDEKKRVDKLHKTNRGGEMKEKNPAVEILENEISIIEKRIKGSQRDITYYTEGITKEQQEIFKNTKIVTKLMLEVQKLGGKK